MITTISLVSFVYTNYAVDSVNPTQYFTQIVDPIWQTSPISNFYQVSPSANGATNVPAGQEGLSIAWPGTYDGCDCTQSSSAPQTVVVGLCSDS